MMTSGGTDSLAIPAFTFGVVLIIAIALITMAALGAFAWMKKHLTGD